MIRGLYTAAMGMNVQAKRLDIISNDLANTDTAGYKKDNAVITSFKEHMISRLNDSENFTPNEGEIGKMVYGATVSEVYTNFMQGSVISTGRATDLALQGEGFFTVNTPNGVSYTRDGSFRVNQEGKLVTSEGYEVIGEEGAIELGEDYFTLGKELAVKPDGSIYVGETYIDKLNLVDFENKKQLVKQGSNLYTSSEEPIAFTGSILQSYIEKSNVNTVTAMVDMITVSRAYETNQKMIQTQDSLLGKAVNELGRV